MLQLLDYSVAFPTTGRSFQNRIEFAPGLTAITGRNEAGKTLVVEMIGYALFGKDALRGLASDYSNLSVTLALTVRDEEWLITRAKKEEFTVNGEVVAVGAQAINAEVPKRLGFDLKVFNIACAAQQGDLGALTEMKPTARRQMVDQLIGLDLLEGIEKECKQEAKTNETVALSLLASAREPVEPTQPEGYVPSAELETKLSEVQVHEAERQRLLGLAEPVKPVPPVAPDFTDVADLEQHEAQRQSALRDQAALQGQLRGMPATTVSREELQKAIDFKAYADELKRRGPKPDYTPDQLKHFEAILDAQSAESEEVTCPNCEHHFHPGLSAVEEELRVQVSPLTYQQIFDQQRRNLAWEQPLEEVETFELPNLQQEITAHAFTDERTRVVAALEALDIPMDRSADLRAARAYQNELAIFGERTRQYDLQLAGYQDAQSRLATLADRSGELVDLQGRIAAARHFEQLRDGWLRDAERYDAVRAQAEQARERGDGFSRGSVALRNARSRVKQELAPSLSKAASSLLYTMTDGERRHVDVDHDFNIIVDGQPLQTLSGSGKSVVNLALRIGLGQVLTSKVLPIFMGDEIDKDMDQVRASSTHGTFQSLREYLTQIILVTHKEVEADQVIQL
jgi:DNA repair exonuclease SbcCD ATPase subunit